MNSSSSDFLILAGVLLAALVLLSLAGRRQFRERVAKDLTKLFADAGPAVGAEQVAGRMDGLPGPVRRHLQYAISPKAPPAATARLKHEGYFRAKPGRRWSRIRGEQYFTIGKPGFVWNASIRPVPLVWVEARDRLLAGSGDMLVTLNSTFMMAHSSSKETGQSASVRWLMEAVWFPYGYVSPDVRWESIDSRTARVSLLHDGLPVTVVVEIDDEGKVVRVSGERYRDTGRGKAVLTPWVGTCQEYKEFSGFRVPTFVEGSWMLPGGEFPYVRFRVTVLEYNVPKQF